MSEAIAAAILCAAIFIIIELVDRFGGEQDYSG
jgi:hypothetical protein